MQEDEIYIERCLELAQRGRFNTSPNPRVGAVIVYDGKIIGEGYHEKCGEAHAEVNAINSVENKNLLAKSTIYVSLEPCSHFGKTPPCADLIIMHKIPRVVICNTDPFVKVNGSGIEMLLKNNIEVKTNVLAPNGEYVNRRFFTFHSKKRPYVILKWAETNDGFISRNKDNIPLKDNWITSQSSKTLVHSWRAEEDAILIGAQTAIIDKPQLNTRLVEGKSPSKILIDPDLEVQFDKILSMNNKWIVFNATKNGLEGHIEYIKVDFSGDVLNQIMDKLYELGIQSLIVEGGTYTLNSFIRAELWDEARQFISTKTFGSGIAAPSFYKSIQKSIRIENDTLNFYYNTAQ